MVKELKTINIDWDTVRNLQDFEAHYDKKTDMLLIQTNEDR